MASGWCYLPCINNLTILRAQIAHTCSKLSISILGLYKICFNLRFYQIRNDIIKHSYINYSVSPINISFKLWGWLNTRSVCHSECTVLIVIASVCKEFLFIRLPKVSIISFVCICSTRSVAARSTMIIARLARLAPWCYRHFRHFISSVSKERTLDQLRNERNVVA